MDENRINPHSRNNQQIQQIHQAENAPNTSTWNGRIINRLKEVKNRIVNFFLNLFTSKNRSKATPTDIPDNLRIGAKTATENSTVKINKANTKLAIKELKQKGFSSKETKAIIERISSQDIPEPDIMTQIADVAEKKYYHKYDSQSAIFNKISDSLQHLEELGYDPTKYNNFIYSLLDDCDNFEEFDDRFKDIPTLKERKLGYTSANDVKQDKEIFLTNLQDNGYDANTAKLMIDKMYEETNDKNNILTKVLQTPTVKMRNQGYSNQQEYTKLNDEYTAKLTVKVGNSKKAYNIVKNEQEQASSKQEFINNMRKRLES